MVRHPRPDGGVRVAVVAVNYQRFSMVDTATGIRIKMRAPVRGPLSAIPRIESIIVLTMGNAVFPMIVDIYVIEIDVIVGIMVVPAPSIRPPPGMCPGSEPESVAESEAKAHIPIVGETRAESIGARTAYPIASDIGWVGPARAVNHDVVRADLSAEIARCVTDVHIVGGCPIDLRVSYVMERRTDGNAVNDRWHIGRDFPSTIRRAGDKPNAVFHAVETMSVHFNHRCWCVHRVLKSRAGNWLKRRCTVIRDIQL